MDASYSDVYFDWLKTIVYSYDEDHASMYDELLYALHCIQFRYLLTNDGNRLSDGRHLRHRFAYDHCIPYSEIDNELYGPVSLLEVMIALALRGEESIMRDYEYGDRTGLWFWQMIDCMHLSSQTNDNFDLRYVFERADILMDRKFEANGDGGWFKIDNPPTDLRKVEFWYQMNWYFTNLIYGS